MRWIFIGMVFLNVAYFSWHQYSINKSGKNDVVTSLEDGSIKSLILLSEKEIQNAPSQF